MPSRYNAAPGQEHWVIRQNPKTGERTLDRLCWGLIPHWCKDEDGGSNLGRRKNKKVPKPLRDTWKGETSAPRSIPLPKQLPHASRIMPIAQLNDEKSSRKPHALDFSFHDFEPILTTQIQVCLAANITPWRSPRRELVKVVELTAHPARAPEQAALQLISCGAKRRY